MASEPQTVPAIDMKNQIKTIVGILKLLDERERRGALAHEIGHIRNRDILVSTIAAALAGAIACIANMLFTHPPMAERVRRLREMSFMRFAA